jgi:hypothetical protein
MRLGAGRLRGFLEHPAATTDNATAIPKTRAIENIFPGAESL